MLQAEQNTHQAIAGFIASGEYTDFISGSEALYDAEALLPIDQYWDDYPNIKNLMPAEKWNRFRQSDGHIYWIPQFGVVHGNAVEVLHEGEAFWIQTRVLKWAGYPDIRTIDEYFALLEAYTAENPVMEDPLISLSSSISFPETSKNAVNSLMSPLLLSFVILTVNNTTPTAMPATIFFLILLTSLPTFSII